MAAASMRNRVRPQQNRRHAMGKTMGKGRPRKPAEMKRPALAYNGQRRRKQEKGAAMSFEDLKKPEFQEKLKGASTPEEIFALAKEEGAELPDELLEDVAGGKEWNELFKVGRDCTSCGTYVNWYKSEGAPTTCPFCGAPF